MISKVSMAVDRNIGICGLRLYDTSGSKLVDENWSGKESRELASMWVTKDIPDGQYIIGVKASTRNDQGNKFLTRLGWQLWNPSTQGN